MVKCPNPDCKSENTREYYDNRVVAFMVKCDDCGHIFTKRDSELNHYYDRGL